MDCPNRKGWPNRDFFKRPYETLSILLQVQELLIRPLANRSLQKPQYSSRIGFGQD